MLWSSSRSRNDNRAGENARRYLPLMNLIKPLSSAKERDLSNALKRNAIEAYRVDVDVKLIASCITKHDAPRRLLHCCNAACDATLLYTFARVNFIRAVCEYQMCKSSKALYVPWVACFTRLAFTRNMHHRHKNSNICNACGMHAAFEKLITLDFIL